MLQNQLDRKAYRVRVNHARLRVSARHYYIPDVAVIPIMAQESGRGDPDELDAYSEPLPLVVEIWSPSTDEYDVETKLRGYQERGDFEIWRIHPYDRTLTAWRRTPDGQYDVSIYRGGQAPILALPNVAIDIDELLSE